jgi:hypothetical protein
MLSGECRVILVAGERARLTPTGTWGVIDPAKRGENGPLGNGITAGSSAALPGGKEGCLMVRIGENAPYCFSEKSGSQIVFGPGEIRFRGNDDLGLGDKDINFQSFRDNFGMIKIFIEINSE